MSGRRPGLPGSKIDSGDCDIGALAQLVEHLTFNQVVTGSNPVRPTISRRLHPAAPASDTAASADAMRPVQPLQHQPGFSLPAAHPVACV